MYVTDFLLSDGYILVDINHMLPICGCVVIFSELSLCCIH
jgi:hypothetical protein